MIRCHSVFFRWLHSLITRGSFSILPKRNYSQRHEKNFSMQWEKNSHRHEYFFSLWWEFFLITVRILWEYSNLHLAVYKHNNKKLLSAFSLLFNDHKSLFFLKIPYLHILFLSNASFYWRIEWKSTQDRFRSSTLLPENN